AIELAPLGFTTAAVAPGFVETPLTDFGLRSDPAVRQVVTEQIPLRRIGTVEDVAGWYVFLASDAARYATGIVVSVDGGLDAQEMGVRPVIGGDRRSWSSRGVPHSSWAGRSSSQPPCAVLPVAQPHRQ